MITPTGPAAARLLQPEGPPGPADPFWEVVRRRRPDLHPVLLPPDPPGSPGEPGAGGPVLTVSEDELAVLLRRTASVLGRVWADLLEEPDRSDLPDPAGAVAVALRPGPARGTRVAVGARVCRGLGDATALDRLPAALPGWERPPVHDLPEAPVRRRVAVEPGGCRLEATYRVLGGVLVLRVRSTPVRVADER